MATKIVLGSRAHDQRLDKFRQAYPQVQFVASGSPEEVVREIADADAFFGNPTREQYRAAKKLRWIQAPSAGIEFVRNVPELVDSEVVLTNARGAHAQTIAEHTFAMLLTLTRALPYFAEAKKRREWGRGEGYRQVVGLAGKTMGIVGFGNIGRAIARRAKGFEMRVIAVDAQPVAGGDLAESVWGLDRLDDLMKQSDVVAIAAPITNETRGMIGAKQIQEMKRGAYLIVVSRGGIVDERALIQALEDGHLAGAGLDVTETEPLPADNPLWDAPHLIITPHISGGSELTTELMWSIFFENVGHFVKGEPLKNVTDKKLGY
jgi:phosphoglycerate dehydrogenase-like enzyme